MHHPPTPVYTPSPFSVPSAPEEFFHLPAPPNRAFLCSPGGPPPMWLGCPPRTLTHPTTQGCYWDSRSARGQPASHPEGSGCWVSAGEGEDFETFQKRNISQCLVVDKEIGHLFLSHLPLGMILPRPKKNTQSTLHGGREQLFARQISSPSNMRTRGTSCTAKGKKGWRVEFHPLNCQIDVN